MSSATPATPKPFRPDELAQRWDVPEQTITANLRKKVIRGFQIGKLWRVWPQEVERIEAGGAAPAA
jgi:hypothetical protein